MTGVDQFSFILTGKNKKNKPLKKWPITASAGFYADRVTDASCISKHLDVYDALPTLYVEPVQYETDCIFESCNESSNQDGEVTDSEDSQIYFFPGGEASCPVADFTRSWYSVEEINSEGWKLNIKINGIETNNPKLVNQAVLLR